MDGNLGHGHICYLYRLTCALDRSECHEVVEHIFGEVGGGSGTPLIRDGRYEDRVAEEELVLDRVGRLVFGVLEPEWVEDGCAVKVGLVECCEEVVNEAVSVGQ